MDIEREQFRAQSRVTTHPVRRIIRLQSKWAGDAETDRKIAVARIAKNRLRQIRVADDVKNAGIPVVRPANRQSVEWSAGQVIARALVRKFVRRDNGVQPHLEFAVIQSGETSRIVEERGDVFSARRAPGKSSAEAAHALFAQDETASANGKRKG